MVAVLLVMDGAMRLVEPGCVTLVLVSCIVNCVALERHCGVVVEREYLGGAECDTACLILCLTASVRAAMRSWSGSLRDAGVPEDVANIVAETYKTGQLFSHLSLIGQVRHVL